MSSGKTEKIYGINGPVIYLKGKTDFKMSEMVHVGEEKLVGEVISLDKDRTTVQVYEETSGLHPGELVEGTGAAVSVTLAPGILNNIFDGIERPLERIADKGGAFITRGVSVDALDRQKLWETHITVAEGDMVQGGTIIAEVLSCTNVWFLRERKELLYLWFRMVNIRLMRRWLRLNCSMEKNENFR